jgi:hypothetical protein
VKNAIFACLLGLACFSCSQVPPPNAVLSEEQMVSILFDVQLTEGKVSSLPVTFDSAQVLYALMEKDIFLKHGVTDSVFTSSMLYYLEDAGKMDRIYARVIDSLVVLENTPTPKE